MAKLRVLVTLLLVVLVCFSGVVPIMAQEGDEANLAVKPISITLEVPLEGALIEPRGMRGVGSDWQNIMTEDFEGPFPGAGWNVFTTGITDAYWGKDDHINHTAGGSYSAFCAKEGAAGVDPPAYYPNDMVAWMVYGPFSLADALDAELNFYLWLATQYGVDWAFWTASTDGSNFSGWGYSGDTGGWIPVTLDLTDIDPLGNLCGELQVWVAFLFISDDSAIDYGAFIDDVVLRRYLTYIPAEFSGTPTAGATPLEVQFTDESVGDFDTWSWDFGDGGTSNEQNPTHVYTHPGPFTVSLNVSGLSGIGTETKVDYIHPYTMGVGGEAYPVNKTGIILPWVALGMAVVAVMFVVLRRRRFTANT